MTGDRFKKDLLQATGVAWEEWDVRLQHSIRPEWSNGQIMAYIRDEWDVAELWAEWLSVMYGQLLGRIPVGVTKDAGVQIGVRKTIPAAKEQVWNYMASLDGLRLWIGDVPSFEWRKGYEFSSADGISGKLTVIEPLRKLRMTWRRADWEKPSRLQLYVLDAGAGKTTIAIHQEMLEDVYMRELMRRHWDDTLMRIAIALQT